MHLSAAGLLLFEHTWEIGLKEAIKNAGAIAITGGFVSPEALIELEKDLEGKNTMFDGATSSLYCSIVKKC